MEKSWDDGSGDKLTATYTETEATFTSDENEGIDRSMDVFFKGEGLTVVRTAKQQGKRETFYVTEGEFLVTDGNFNVIKDGIQ